MSNNSQAKGQEGISGNSQLQSSAIGLGQSSNTQSAQIDAEKARKRAEISRKRAEAGRKGGKAAHKCRGLGCADEQTRKSVSSKGGSAPHKSRGRQSKKSVFN